MQSRLLLAALTLVPPAFGQPADGTAFSERPLPANVTNITASGSLVVVHAAAVVEVYSTVLRAWSSIPVGSTAILHLGENLCVVDDAGVLHACAAHSTGFATLRPAAGYAVAMANDATLCTVRDGNTVNACSGFFGQWVPVTLTSAARFHASDSNLAVAADDANVHAFSAFHNAWRATPSQPGARHVAGKSCAITLLAQPDTVKAFSAYRDAWASQAWPTARASASAADGYALVVGAPDLLAFSALRGTFLTFPARGQPIQALVMAANVAVIWDGAQDFAYAPGHHRFVQGWTTASTPGQFHMTRGNATTSFVSHAGLESVAYSSIKAAFATAPGGSYTWTAGDHVAFGRDASATAHVAYSGVTGTFATAPPVAVTRVLATPESVVLETPAGLVAYSARTGAFSPNGSAGTSVAWRIDASIVAAADAFGVDVFDPVLGRFSRVVTTSSVSSATMAVAGVTAIARSAGRAYGYSLFTNTWDSIALQGTATGHGAGNESAFVSTDTHVYAFGAHGSFSVQSRHPDLPRAAVLGTSLNMVQTGPPGAVAMLIGTRTTEIPIPTYGILRVDLTSAVSLPAGTIPGSGVLPFTLALPERLGMIGTALALQNVVLPAQGPWFLTNSRIVIPW